MRAAPTAQWFLPTVLPAGRRGRSAEEARAFRDRPGRVTAYASEGESGWRHRGIGRRLVERVEAETRLPGGHSTVLGTDEAVGCWYHHGSRLISGLLFQWVYDQQLYEPESEAVLSGPLAGRRGARRSTTSLAHRRARVRSGGKPASHAAKRDHPPDVPGPYLHRLGSGRSSHALVPTWAAGKYRSRGAG